MSTRIAPSRASPFSDWGQVLWNSASHASRGYPHAHAQDKPCRTAEAEESLTAAAQGDRSPPPLSPNDIDSSHIDSARRVAAKPPSLELFLGFGPRFGLVAGNKGLAIEHLTVVRARLRIPGLGLGRLPGVRIHAPRVMALEKAPAPG